MGIQREIWVNHIEGGIFKDNEFLTKAFDEGEHVLGGAVVHIPQSGSKPGVELNRSTLPASAQERADSDVNYALGWYSTDPFRVRNAEQAELSYDKMDSILGEHLDVLRERIGDEMAIKWLAGAVAAGNVARTTGGAAAATEAGQTGNRKMMILKDFANMKTRLNKQGISKANRVAVVESNMLQQLTDSLSATQSTDFSRYYDGKSGVIGRLEGFDIMERSDVAIANAAAGAINSYGAVTATDDNVAALFFQKHAVSKAVGEINIFHNEQDATHYGDITSADVRFGGRTRRSGAEGVWALIQDASA